MLFFLLSAVCWPSLAQSHLDYRYVLDAVLSEVNTEQGMVYRIEASQRPEFATHHSQEVLSSLNELLGEGMIGLASEEVKAVLQHVEINDLMTERQITEMLLARAGMLDQSLQPGKYELEVYTTKIEFTDHRSPLFNVSHRAVIRKLGEKKSSETERLRALDWRNGLPLHIETLGGKKLIDCVEQHVKEDGALWKEWMGEEWVKTFTASLDCTTQLQVIQPDFIGILPMELQDALPDRTAVQSAVVNIPRTCFESDKPCTP